MRYDAANPTAVCEERGRPNHCHHKAKSSVVTCAAVQACVVHTLKGPAQQHTVAQTLCEADLGHHKPGHNTTCKFRPLQQQGVGRAKPSRYARGLSAACRTGVCRAGRPAGAAPPGRAAAAAWAAARPAPSRPASCSAPRTPSGTRTPAGLPCLRSSDMSALSTAEMRQLWGTWLRRRRASAFQACRTPPGA